MQIEIHEPPHPDMPAWSLTESDEGYGKRLRHIRRTQVFQFNRIVEYVEDIGKGNGIGFIVPGGIRKPNGHYESLHSAGELRDIAESFKLTKNDPLNLYHDEQEQRQSARKGRKVYGRNSARS